MIPGFEPLEDLRDALLDFASNDSCFVIAPIGEAGSEVRRRSDQILKHVIRPAAEACGMKATRADEIAEPGLITNQVVGRLISDKWVIADLTGRNPNVYYELAIRHAIRRPIVQLIEAGESIPFDIAGTRVIQINHRDLDSVEQARLNLISAMNSLGDGVLVESPITAAVGLAMLDNLKGYFKKMDELKEVMWVVADSIRRVDRPI